MTEKKELAIEKKISELSPWQELPRIELYMDQLLSIMHQELKGLWLDEEEVNISASMVNNYVKVKLVPAPVKKRYERQHICALLLVFILKPILSMQDLNLLIPSLLLECSEDWSNLHAALRLHLTEALEGKVIEVSTARPYETVLIHALSAFSERLSANRLLRELNNNETTPNESKK